MTRTPASRMDACDFPQLAALLLGRLRSERSRVHAITNSVAQAFTANMLLAAGGIPSLTVAPDEVPFFTRRSDALLVNLGTLDSERRKAILLGIATARDHGKPWVLDPVFVEASPSRLEFAQSCLSGEPCVLRCNASEFRALAGCDADLPALQAFAQSHRTVVALTGEIDWITDGARVVRVDNGHPLMAHVTAMGCAGTALIAAFSALHGNALEAAVAAVLVTGVAGEIAGAHSKGPGGFQPAFLDAVFNLDSEILTTHGRVS